MYVPDRIRIEYDGLQPVNRRARVVDLASGEDVKGIGAIRIALDPGEVIAELSFYDPEMGKYQGRLAMFRREYPMPDLRMTFERDRPELPLGVPTLDLLMAEDVAWPQDIWRLRVKELRAENDTLRHELETLRETLRTAPDEAAPEPD